MAQSNHHKLAEGSVRESLIRMTTPMIIGMLMMFTFNIVDTLFISFLGTDPLTAISFTFPVGFTILSLAIGLGIGASAVVAKYLGRGEIERAKEAATVINYISATMASLMIVLCWIFLDEIFRLLGAGDGMLVLRRRF
ncbi:MAG: MATE family efflux transporter, partial [Gammaproteobacteria bacterium]|nr:MATE family efflux transporter [Gammaproteobacteria bacterium]